MKVLNHIIIWVTISTISVVVKLAEMKWSFDWIYVFETYSKYILAALIFYTAYLIYKKFYLRKKYFKTAILLAGLLFANGCLRYIVFSRFFVVTGIFPMYGYDFWQTFTIGIWWWYMFSLFSFAYYMFQKSLLTERQLHFAVTNRLNTEKENLQLKAENLELQNQKLIAEYNYLKSQINPHFLYNTLNYFYAETMLESPKAARGISLLSQIMRYSLQPAETDGKVPLADEVLHLNNYLSLQRMRFDEDLRLDCSLPANIPAGYRILSHLLITLAENAFKHGEPGTPISISLDILNGGLSYIVSNTARLNRPESKNGVGLQNMQDRLTLYYGSNACLEFIKQDGKFTAKLEIKHVAMPEVIADHHHPETIN